jgi:hypothetical protein
LSDPSREGFFRVPSLTSDPLPGDSLKSSGIQPAPPPQSRCLPFGGHQPPAERRRHLGGKYRQRFDIV